MESNATKCIRVIGAVFVLQLGGMDELVNNNDKSLTAPLSRNLLVKEAFNKRSRCGTVQALQQDLYMRIRRTRSGMIKIRWKKLEDCSYLTDITESSKFISFPVPDVAYIETDVYLRTNIYTYAHTSKHIYKLKDGAAARRFVGSA